MSIWVRLGDFAARLSASTRSGLAGLSEALRSAFVGDPQIRLIAVEGGGKGDGARHSARLGKGRRGIFHGAETLVLTGVAGNFCVLFTAHDAYMRDFHLVVPRDCVASQTPGDDRYALEHMATVTKADTRPSSDIDFAELQ